MPCYFSSMLFSLQVPTHSPVSRDPRLAHLRDPRLAHLRQQQQQGAAMGGGSKHMAGAVEPLAVPSLLQQHHQGAVAAVAPVAAPGLQRLLSRGLQPATSDLLLVISAATGCPGCQQQALEALEQCVLSFRYGRGVGGWGASCRGGGNVRA